MRNNLKNFLLILSYCLFTFKSVYAIEPFVFDATEIEILENGNQINGYKGGKVISEDGSEIIAQSFLYNKITNILEAIGDVKYLNKLNNTVITSDKAIYFKNDEKIYTSGNSKAINENNSINSSSLEYDKISNIFKAKKDAVVNDFEKDVTIFADEITYFKNEEKVFTKGKTKALIENKYKFKSKNVTYYKNSGDLNSQKKSSVEDDDGNIYKLNNFTYNINTEVLKGKKVEV